MNAGFRWSSRAILTGLCALAGVAGPDSIEAQEQPRPSYFRIDTTSQLPVARNQDTLLLRERHLGVELRDLRGGGTWSATPREDLVVVILQGTGAVTVGSTTTPVGSGGVVHLPALTSLSWAAGKDGLRLATISARSRSQQVGPAFHHLDSVRSGPDLSENQWNPFLRVPALVAGLYELPVSQKGDDYLTHPSDEVNLVLEGRALFDVEGASTPVHRGSVMYVPAGLRHRFHTLSSTTRILILWNRPAPPPGG